MTNILEIIAALQQEGLSRINADVSDGRIYIICKKSVYDITTKSLNDQLKLLVKLLENN